MSDYYDQPCTLCPERGSTIFADGSRLCRTHADEAYVWARAVDQKATADAGGPFEQNTPCPRRGEGPAGAYPGIDLWEYGHGLITTERLLTCTFCGSVKPEEFLAKVREGWVVGPTDKNYKAYLGKPYTDEEQAEYKAKWLTGWQAQGVRDHGHSEEEVEVTFAEKILPTHTDRDVGKFYFQHLSAEQRKEFITLYNDKVMRIGYPGYFYAKPYFATEVSG